MKKLLFTLTLLFCLSCFGQKQKATLFFKDSTKVEGYASFYHSQKIKFKKPDDKIHVVYSSTHLDKIIIRKNDVDTEYHYKYIKGRNKSILLEVLEIGKVNLYRLVVHSGSFPGMNFGNDFGNGFGYSGGNSFNVNYYYISKDNDNTVNLGNTSIFSKNFKKAISKYFKDCPELVNKVQSKEFRKRDIVEIVEFYNENCSE